MREAYLVGSVQHLSQLLEAAVRERRAAIAPSPPRPCQTAYGNKLPALRHIPVIRQHVRFQTG